MLTLPPGYRRRAGHMTAPTDFFVLSGSLRIGDSLSNIPDLEFQGIPRFAPEHFARIICEEPMRRKQMDAGLRQLTEDVEPRLKAVWPRDTKFERRCYELLREAYVKARYSRHYRISDEQLA